MGNSYFQVAKYEESIAAYETLSDSNYPDLQYKISQGYLKLNTAEATKKGNNLLSTVLTKAKTSFNQGKKLEKQKNYSAAIDSYKQATSIYPDYIDGIYHLSLCYFLAGDNANGKLQYEELLQKAGKKDQKKVKFLASKL